MTRIRETIKKFNDLCANRMAAILSTMWIFYILTALIIIPLFYQSPVGFIAWIQYIVSVGFQGVALPVLAFVAKKEGESQAKLLQETHDMVMSEMAIIKNDSINNIEVLKGLHESIELLKKDAISNKCIEKELQDISDLLENDNGT